MPVLGSDNSIGFEEAAECMRYNIQWFRSNQREPREMLSTLQHERGTILQGSRLIINRIRDGERLRGTIFRILLVER